MNKYLIANCGCDDTTEFEIELNDEELKTIMKFIKANNLSSSYSCQPIIRIYGDYFYENNEPTTCTWVNGKWLNAEELKDSDINDRGVENYNRLP